MKERNAWIQKALLRDGILLLVFLCGYIALSSFVISQVLVFTTDSLLSGLVCGFATLCALILGGAMVWIFLYLMKNKREVYRQELDMKERILEEKDGVHHEEE